MSRPDEDREPDTPVVRQQDFATTGPVEIVVELGAGLLDIRLVTEPGRAGGAGEPGDDPSGGLSVRVRPDPTGTPPWSAGIAGLLSWLGEQAGAAPQGELATEAARRTLIDFTDGRLTVRTPRDVPLRGVPLVVQVSAPTGSPVTARAGSADVTVDGVAGGVDVSTGSGQVRVRQCDGAVDIRTGSGDVRLGTVRGALRVQTGSGTVDLAALEGSGGSGVRTGSGDVRFGAVAQDVTARTGSGDLVVVDASAGELELGTGSGRLRIGIHPGTRAEVDVSSGSGRARSELPVASRPPDGAIGLRVRARTGSGDALVTSAPTGPGEPGDEPGGAHPGSAA